MPPDGLDFPPDQQMLIYANREYKELKDTPGIPWGNWMELWGWPSSKKTILQNSSTFQNDKNRQNMSFFIIFHHFSGKTQACLRQPHLPKVVRVVHLGETRTDVKSLGKTSRSQLWCVAYLYPLKMKVSATECKGSISPVMIWISHLWTPNALENVQKAMKLHEMAAFATAWLCGTIRMATKHLPFAQRLVWRWQGTVESTVALVLNSTRRRRKLLGVP